MVSCVEGSGMVYCTNKSHEIMDLEKLTSYSRAAVKVNFAMPQTGYVYHVSEFLAHTLDSLPSLSPFLPVTHLGKCKV